MSKSKALAWIIVFAFITRLLLLFAFPLQDTDFYMINSAAENLANGHGLGFQRSSINDLSIVHFEALRLWPPLLTILVAAFIKLTGSAFIANTLLLSLFALVFFYSVNKILLLLKLQTNTKALIYLFIATNPETIKVPGLSDMAGATLCLAACAGFINLLYKKQNFQTSTLFFTGILFFLPSAFRYQYYPLSYFFPIIFLLYSLRLKDQQLVRKSIILLLIIFALTCLQEILLYNYSKQPLTQSVAMDKSGFFISNLQKPYPFWIKSFINLSYLENKFIFNQLSVEIFYIFLFMCFVAAFVIKMKFLFKKIQNEQDSIRNFSLIFLLIASVIPFATLLLLSLTRESQTNKAGSWTYINEGRYYILSSVLLLIVTASYFQELKKQVSDRMKNIGLKCVIGILTFNGLLTAKFYANYILDNIPDRTTTTQNDRKRIDSLIDKLRIKKKEPIVITFNEPNFAFYPFKPNIAVTQKIPRLAKHEFSTSKETKLLIIADKPLTSTDSLLIAKTNAKKLATLNTSQLYIAEIHPASTKEP